MLTLFVQIPHEAHQKNLTDELAVTSVYLQLCFHLITRSSICHTMEHVNDSTTSAMAVVTRGEQLTTTEGQEPDEDVYEFVSAR